jgi:hypothetical protein
VVKIKLLIKLKQQNQDIDEINRKLINLNNALAFEILLYFLYVITALPLVELIEIVKELVKIKFIATLKNQYYPL